MKFVTLLAALLLILSTSAAPQGRGFPKPPTPADPARAPLGSQPVLKARVDTVQLQREARELSELANTLPEEMDRVSHGLLNKDLPDKLKRIEKLSKHLRSEIQP